jgi:hypothetical protein
MAVQCRSMFGVSVSVELGRFGSGSATFIHFGNSKLGREACHVPEVCPDPVLPLTTRDATMQSNAPSQVLVGSEIAPFFPHSTALYLILEWCFD